MTKVDLYTTQPCSYCTRLKGLLDARGVDFNEINLDKDPDGRAELVQRTGMMTFPQVTVDGHLLGGWAEFQAALQDGRFDELLASASEQ
jgi:glutaredoxin 3